MPPPSPTLPVVCAIIERDGDVLVAQRPPHKHLPLKWEFPGGKIEPGEDPVDALRREIREELGCELADMEPLPPARHDYGALVIHMLPYVTRLDCAHAVPVAHEHVSLQWVRPEQLLKLDLAAADVPVVRAYLDR